MALRDMPKNLLLTVALLVFTIEAHSQVALRPKSSTKEEYRACMKEESALKAQKVALRDRTEAHSANLKRLQDEVRAHVATQPIPGHPDDDAVNAFNEKIGALNARADASNKEAERLNLELHNLNSKIAAVNERCAGMVVPYADHKAVLKERAEAAKQR